MAIVLGGNGIYIATGYSAAPAVDPDAQAFITAASITNPTQQSAINQLVTDLKGYGVWTKMKALYPFIGGTASSHKFNLKNPLDTDAAFRLVFNGGWTHSANGALPNGVNGFANTNVNALNNLSLNSTHFSVYSRTNSSGDKRDIGAHANSEGSALILNLGGLTYYKVNSTIGNYLTVANSNSQGNFMSNRTASNVLTGWKNGVKVATGSNASTSLLNAPIYLGALWENSNASYFSDRQYAFASIGDGLTDTEAANFYTAVQTFQVTLGRSIGTQTVSDADAQAFVTNAGIVDQVEADAVNNLVIGLKADGLWSKMKAVYPFVGSSATSNSYNLKNTAQYQITWNGGVTHNSNGITFGGVNGFGNTFLNPSLLPQNSNSQMFYNRVLPTTVSYNGTNDFLLGSYSNGTVIQGTSNSTSTTLTSSTFNGLISYIRRSSGQSDSVELYRNGITLQTDNFTSKTPLTNDYYIGALNNAGTAQLFSSYNLAFASLGDGLTDTEVANFYTRVQAFNTTLNRQV